MQWCRFIRWKYPDSRGLEYVIESERFYPITILPSLTSSLLEIFYQRRLMLVQDLLNIDVVKFSKKTGISEKRSPPSKERQRYCY